MKIFCPFIMLRYLLVFYVVIFSTTALSVEVTDLYVAKIPVASQVNAERDKALKKAMAAVLVKVGGQESVLTEPLLKKALANSRSYMSQYRYVRNNDENQLLASFDEAKINQLFIEANLPLWGSLRPQVLLWLVEEDGLSRDILSASANSPLPPLVADFSDSRGLPILLPLMDLTDVSQINIADFWGRFKTPIEQASQRYIAEMAVVVRISNDSLITEPQAMDNCQPLCGQKSYVIDWTLFSDSQSISSKSLDFSYQGVNKSSLLEQGLADITQVIYQRYALATNSEQEYTIDIANVDDMATYVTIVEFLQELSSVSSIQLKQAKGNSRRFSLELIGSKQAFLASLKLNKKLAQFIDPLADIDPNAVPVFLWESE